MADEADMTSDREELHTNLMIANHQSRPREQPEFGDNGEKLCIDCGNEIPKARAALDFVVRCIYCQNEEEARGRQTAHHASGMSSRR